MREIPRQTITLMENVQTALRNIPVPSDSEIAVTVYYDGDDVAILNQDAEKQCWEMR